VSYKEHGTASMLHPLASRCGERRRVTRVLLPADDHLIDGSTSATVADQYVMTHSAVLPCPRAHVPV
jgi:hypothetical protein